MLRGECLNNSSIEFNDDSLLPSVPTILGLPRVFSLVPASILTLASTLSFRTNEKHGRKKKKRPGTVKDKLGLEVLRIVSRSSRAEWLLTSRGVILTRRRSMRCPRKR